MNTIIAILMMPIMILNFLGGIVSGIWLLFLGEWKMLFNGLLFLFAGSFCISIAMMPGLFLFAMPAASLYEKHKIPAMILGFFNLVYTIFLITIWCLTIMAIFVSSSNERSFIPAVIWSYGIALGPWMHMAYADNQGSERNEFSLFTILWTQVTYIIAMVMFFFGVPRQIIAQTFLLCMLGLMLLEGIIFSLIAKHENVVKRWPDHPRGKVEKTMSS